MNLKVVPLPYFAHVLRGKEGEEGECTSAIWVCITPTSLYSKFTRSRAAASA